MKQICVVAIFACMFLIANCGSSSSSSDPVTTGFHISGTLPQSVLSSSVSPGKDSGNAGTVTDVLLVSPGSNNMTCKTGTVDATTGKFDVEVTPQNFWSVFFYNRNYSGRNMFSGWFRSSWMDGVLANKTTGTASLGSLTLDTTAGTASTDQTETTMVDEMGVTTATAETVGGQDDVVGRYSNPDADDDGLVDCNETGHTFMLDFHIRYDIKVSGTGATVSDIIDSYYNENTTTFSYSTTGVYIAYPTTFSSASTGTVKFVDTDVIIETNSYGALAKNTATSAVSDNSFSGYYSFGPNLTTASSLPSGEIDFVFGDKTLTFTKVETPSLATLSAPTGRIFPFLKLNKTNSACTSNCTLASFDYKWMKKTASGWEAATLQEVGLLVKDTGGVFSFRYNTDGNSSQTVQFAIPNTSISGTVTWTAANATLSGVTETAFTNLYTTQICHVGLSYDDKLGMRYFQNISNAAGTCS